MYARNGPALSCLINASTILSEVSVNEKEKDR